MNLVLLPCLDIFLQGFYSLSETKKIILLTEIFSIDTFLLKIFAVPPICIKSTSKTLLDYKSNNWSYNFGVRIAIALLINIAMKVLMLLFIFVILFSCNNHPENNQHVTNKPDTINHTATAITKNIIQPDTSIYGISLSGTSLHLQQWDSTISLMQQIGEPLKQKIIQLDQNSDTFAGSYIKELEYNGLKLQLFSPPQNGKTFWIQQIILLNDKYKTTRDITIGDDFEKVKQVYPTLQKFPGENENMYYVADEGYQKSIEMEFEKNKLKKLRMYYMMN
jgi:hypothetical protein